MAATGELLSFHKSGVISGIQVDKSLSDFKMSGSLGALAPANDAKKGSVKTADGAYKTAAAEMRAAAAPGTESPPVS